MAQTQQKPKPKRRAASGVNPEFLSGEASASPAVEALLATARRLAELGAGAGVVAARNGPRVTTHASVPFDVLTSQDFLEIADYDPHLDRLMVLGSRAPHPHAGLVALLFRAKKEIGALAMVEAAPPGVAEAKRGRTTLENALAILEALRGADRVRWGQYTIVVGRTAEEAGAKAEALLA